MDGYGYARLRVKCLSRLTFCKYFSTILFSAIVSLLHLNLKRDNADLGATAIRKKNQCQSVTSYVLADPVESANAYNICGDRENEQQ
jgi:hypothetical protein